MAEQNYKFNVAMTCGGCSGAVNRVLGKLDGVSSFKADHDIGKEQDVANVEVVATAPYDAVYEKIQKAKKVNWGVDGEGKRIDYPEKPE